MIPVIPVSVQLLGQPVIPLLPVLPPQIPIVRAVTDAVLVLPLLQLPPVPTAVVLVQQ